MSHFHGYVTFEPCDEADGVFAIAACDVPGADADGKRRVAAFPCLYRRPAGCAPTLELVHVVATTKDGIIKRLEICPLPGNSEPLRQWIEMLHAAKASASVAILHTEALDKNMRRSRIRIRDLDREGHVAGDSITIASCTSDPPTRHRQNVSAVIEAWFSDAGFHVLAWSGLEQRNGSICLRTLPVEDRILDSLRERGPLALPAYYELVTDHSDESGRRLDADLPSERKPAPPLILNDPSTLKKAIVHLLLKLLDNDPKMVSVVRAILDLLDSGGESGLIGDLDGSKD